MIVGNGVIFPVTQTANKWLGLLREKSLDFIHEVRLDISCLFENLFLDGG